MELIYQNNYGATFKMKNSPNPDCELQLVIDSIGIFMSHQDLTELKTVIGKFQVPCQCADCKGATCTKIWSSSPRMDFCLKVDKPRLHELEDLIKGTQFILGLDNTLEKYRVKSNLPRNENK